MSMDYREPDFVPIFSTMWIVSEHKEFFFPFCSAMSNILEFILCLTFEKSHRHSSVPRCTIVIPENLRTPESLVYTQGEPFFQKNSCNEI